jgi:hypothetical protein
MSMPVELLRRLTQRVLVVLAILPVCPVLAQTSAPEIPGLGSEGDRTVLAAARPGSDGEVVGLRAREAGRTPEGTAQRSILRCFQSGRLVFESSGQLPLASDAAGHNFGSSDRDVPSIQVLDLHQGLCVLQSPGAAH